MRGGATMCGGATMRAGARSVSVVWLRGRPIGTRWGRGHARWLRGRRPKLHQLGRGRCSRRAVGSVATAHALPV